MVAVKARKIFSRVAGVLGGLFFNRRTSLDRSSQVAPGGLVTKRRNRGPVKRKRHAELARGNSAVLLPGGSSKDRLEKKKPRQRKAHGPIKEDELIARELNTLMFDKSWRENWFKITAVSERVKSQTAERKAKLERETREAERLWELEKPEEKERFVGWKDRRLVQLEREKNNAQSELAREKIEREHSRLQRASQEQERWRKHKERQKKLKEMDANAAAQREGMWQRENAELRKNLKAKDHAFQRACYERDYMEKMREREKARRLSVEENIRRSHQVQFELYETKWAALQSGVDLDGSKVHLIFFFQIPWPVINMSLTHPTQIRSEHIREFFTHLNARMRVKDELLRWHPDKFDSLVLSRVHEGDKAAAAEVAGMITRVLTDMLS